MSRGKFIVIEGGDGSGKTTVIDDLKKKLLDVVFTREPGGTDVADEIRALLLKKHEAGELFEPETEILLFEASRVQHLINVVRPALDRGQHVICDRFDSSTWAYEIAGNERSDLKDFFLTINSLVVGETVPDLYLYLDIDPILGLARRNHRSGIKTHYDTRPLDYHQRVQSGFQDFFATVRPGRCQIIAASQPLETVQDAVSRAIGNLLSH